MKRLTDRFIAALKYTGNGHASQFEFDSEVSGLALRLYPSGLKAFVFIWIENGRQSRATIGRHPTWTIGKARRHASTLRLKADSGGSVAAARGARVADLAAKWLEGVAKTRSPATARKYRRMVRHIVARFGRLEPRGITRNDIEQWHAEISVGRPIEGNRALACLGALLGWLVHDHILERNPVPGLRRNAEVSRQVFLGPDEIAAALAALDAETEDYAAALAIKFALLTGCRIGEACGLTAEQIDATHSLWIKQSGQTKQRKLHITPLGKTSLQVARALLDAGPPSYERCHTCWLRVRTAIGRPDVRLHDLRHSRASALARDGASLQQIGKLLGHASPRTTERYSHLVDADLRDLVERQS